MLLPAATNNKRFLFWRSDVTVYYSSNLTRKAPLMIIFVARGVAEGNWSSMEILKLKKKKRKFENFEQKTCYTPQKKAKNM